MATASARAKQRGIAVNRLIEQANATAQALGVEPVEIPTHHRDAAHLPTVQIEAVTELLERIKGAVPAESSDAKTANDETQDQTTALRADIEGDLPEDAVDAKLRRPAKRATKPATARKG